MCTFNITVDEDIMRSIEQYATREEFGRWLQRKVDEIVSAPFSGSPIARTEEELREVVRERALLMASGKAEYIDGEEVFHRIRTRYGL